MNEETDGVRFLFDADDISSYFVYRPPNGMDYASKTATSGVKFAQQKLILDDWYLLGGTKWSRFKFRLKHPIVYSKRGLRSLYRRLKRLFCGEPRTRLSFHWKINTEGLLKQYPEVNNGNNQKQKNSPQHDQTDIGKQP